MTEVKKEHWKRRIDKINREIGEMFDARYGSTNMYIGIVVWDHGEGEAYFSMGHNPKRNILIADALQDTMNDVKYYYEQYFDYRDNA